MPTGACNHRLEEDHLGVVHRDVGRFEVVGHSALAVVPFLDLDPVLEVDLDLDLGLAIVPGRDPARLLENVAGSSTVACCVQEAHRP